MASFCLCAVSSAPPCYSHNGVKTDVSTLYNVKCWHKRCLIDIIDVPGWQGDCNNRHYTVVANSIEIALIQLAVSSRVQCELSVV